MSILTSTLLQWIPHRPPMVWVDEVLSFDTDGGECLVRLKPDALYMTNGCLRLSSLIEFIAQARGFASICDFQKNAPEQLPLKETFIVGISNAIFEDLSKFPEITTDKLLFIKVKSERKLGSITLFRGSVWTSKNACVGSASLKGFSQ